jgi:outer membrane protein assembly factor BamB
MHKVRSILVLFFLSLMHGGVAHAQWVQTNGPYGGMIISLAVSGTNLFAGIGGGVFRSTNNGTSWTVVNNGLTNTSVLALAMTVPATAANWPGWRGPDGTGVSSEKNLPLQWSRNENVRWRVELPGPGNSSPVVWGNLVFIAQAVAQEGRRTLMCFDRAQGKLLWQAGMSYAERERTASCNPYCSGTPVTDGEHVFVCFGSAGVYAYDLAGKEIWHRDLGKLVHMHGNAVSPILYHDLCILNFGPGDKARLIALQKKSGQTAWEVTLAKPQTQLAAQIFAEADQNRDQKLTQDEFTALADAWFGKMEPDKSGESIAPGQFSEEIRTAFFLAYRERNQDSSLTREEFRMVFAKWFAEWDADKSGSLNEVELRDGLSSLLSRGLGTPSGSWSTPLIIKANERDELVFASINRLTAYEPESGKQLWLSNGLDDFVHATPLWGDGVLVAMSGGWMGGSAIAIKPGGSGDVTESRRLWRLERVKSSIGSGVIHDGYLYTISRDGTAACFDLKTGTRVWDERLRGPTGQKNSWSSMLFADGKIYVPNQSGDVFVLRASPKFEILATNSINEPTNASLAASDGELFLRTDKSLWCFAKAK